ncbi:MAG: hypothetical protein COT26_01875 [Candidatus Kerfeldbacteria bacterium CG08_land_8_20_14_0_20_43_14]|uniref:Uncharacterized protein n=1 Tax=Candidatus Kerfeldbacteria bacterium CG08_land_8_20_14_0_20_43_14 TaxID=2014246 RepID=A0A2H0YQD8_9BACT|nr:MAG: hypothetical protein COT26_01875 [Candidatus Kerfeldbacteria bacterium CG08_land_8_20_14_0_20_43_14]
MNFNRKNINNQHEKLFLKSGAGFTLIEVIVATAVFSMAMVLATTVFVVFIQQQRRTITQQEMQNDARSVIEEIAQKLREGVADYAYYSYNFAGVSQKLFSPLSGSDNDCLVIRDALNVQFYYRLDFNAKKIQKYSPATPGIVACNTISANNWVDITPASLTIDGFSIFISPSQNPFLGNNYKACGTVGSAGPPVVQPTPIDADCANPADWGTYCAKADGTCAYQRGYSCYCTPQRFGDVVPLHPKVTFSLTVSRMSNQLTLSETYQTTITSRIFKNFDKLNRYAP